MATEVSVAIDTKVVARVLRGLAIDVETNPTLAALVVDALTAGGLLDDETQGEISGVFPIISPDQPAPSASVPPSALMSLQAARIDLLTLYRTGGAEQLRERLGVLDLASLRRVIQVQELDPEKKMGKSRSAAKLIDFIVEHIGAQVERERELARTNSWML
jgi:hypothetical protein